MVAPRIEWQGGQSPDDLAGEIVAYGERLKAAVLELADRYAGIIQAYMQDNAPWTDRTSNARQGLKAVPKPSGNDVILYLIHTVEYGVYLELGTSRMGARPIILPALEAYIGEIRNALDRLAA